VRKDERLLILRLTVSAVMLVLSISLVMVYNHYRKYHRVDLGRPVAKVNGVKIYQRDLEEFIYFPESFGEVGLEPKTEEKDDGILKTAALEAYVARTIYKMAKKHGVAIDNNVKFLTKKYHEGLTREKFLTESVVGPIKEEDLRERYQQLVNMLKDREERRISHLVVATEEEANRIKNMILRLNNFEAMAEKKSLDKESAANGGSLGYVLKENISIPEFAEVAFLLRIGELSRPIETKNGWHLVRVDDIRNIKIKTYEESKDDILEQIKQERLEEFIDGFAHRPKIELFPKIKAKNSTANTDKTDEEKTLPEDNGSQNRENTREEQSI
jgi:parvulin-like peptidyl-prolyl isomerase